MTARVPTSPEEEEGAEDRARNEVPKQTDKPKIRPPSVIPDMSGDPAVTLWDEVHAPVTESGTVKPQEPPIAGRGDKTVH